MWYGSPSNNRVGYFYLTDTNLAAQREVVKPITSHSHRAPK